MSVFAGVCVCEDEEVCVPRAAIEHLAQSNGVLMTSPPYAALIKRPGFSIN